MSAVRCEQLSDSVTLYCGDCREILPVLGPVDAVVTDPPYDDEAHRPMRRTRATVEGRVGLDDLGFTKISDDLRGAVPAWAASMCSGWMLAFCQVESVGVWRDAMTSAGLRWRRGMVWVKPDSSPQFNGAGPAQGFECVAASWCGTGQSVWNAGGRRGVYVHNVRHPERHGEHKTEKPISLMCDLVSDFSPQRATILDPFMGSGTTGVACVRLGRGFAGIEIDERYFDIACRRIADEMRRPRLALDAPPPAPVQEGLL